MRRPWSLLEFLECNLAIAICINFFEMFLGFFSVLLCTRAFFELSEGNGAVAIGVEFLKDFLGIWGRAVFTGFTGFGSCRGDANGTCEAEACESEFFHDDLGCYSLFDGDT